jgi:membrane protein implicated in regulation of membrane protease activity
MGRFHRHSTLQMPPHLWLGLAGLLLAAVLIGLDSDGLLLVGGLAALLLALLSGSAPLPLAGQLLIFAALVGVAYSLVRRWSMARGERAIPPAAGAELAEVITAFDQRGEGRVRWQGQSWAARNLEPGRPLTSGSAVIVMGREGTRLQVLPHGDSRSSQG